MKSEIVPISSLSTDPANVRKHGQRNLDAIKASLKRFGQQKPIVVDANGVVVAGNGTLEAARSLGWDEIAIVRTSLTGAEATAFAIADNRTAELAEWDDEALAETLATLDDFESIGFDAAEVDDLVSMVSGASASDGRKTLGAARTVKLVVATDTAALVERALRETNKINRGEALEEICRCYLGEEAELDVPMEEDAAAEDAVEYLGSTVRAGNSRRNGKAV
ncbi:MAG TPA: ParB/Srx family N-terminal domain-containing protein [Phycisphaerae bacterium]|nr:ParB/Srx family N-terminal domain-containing protein [Phycisphaerae bacterium]